MTAVNTGMELDPVFVRALRLLHSRSKDSASQLRAMVDDCLRQATSPLNTSAPRSSSSSTSSTKKESDNNKRSLDKLVRDLSELVPANKKSRMDSPGSTKSHTPSPAPTSPGFFEKGSTGSRSVQSGSSSSAEDLDVDLNLEGLNDCTCYICKSFNQENGNKLMECHTCQNLYHQECHIPMVSDEEAADPRLVWNCSDCSKTIKKVSPTVKTSSSSVSKPSKSSSISGIKSARASPSKLDIQSSNTVFKRVDQKGGSSSSTSGGKPAGMAALAASYKSNLSAPVVAPKTVAPPSRSGRTGLGASSLASSSTSGSSSASSTLMTADKRLQMMKKKAAAQRKVR